MPRRRIALLLLLACSLCAGGWFVVGPALAWHQAAAIDDPVAELDGPAGRARRDALLALARAGDARRPVAEAAAPSAAGRVDDGALCGDSDAPVYRPMVPDADGGYSMEAPTPDPDGIVRHLPGEIRAAGTGYLGAMQRVDASLRDSGDPFDRSVADALNIDGLRLPQARVEALVDDALGSDDARSYGLAMTVCAEGGGSLFAGRLPAAALARCGSLSVAEWSRRDPGNAMPWLYALQQANDSGDAAAQTEALRRMAAASRFDIHWGAATAAVASLQMAPADLRAQSDLAASAIAMGLSTPFGALTMRCRNAGGGDPDRAALCEQIGNLLFDHSDAVLARAIGGSVHRLVTGDGSRADQAHAEQLALAAVAGPAAASSVCGEMRDTLRLQARIGKVGELQALEEMRRAAR